MNNRKLTMSVLALALVGGIGAGVVGLASADSTSTTSSGQTSIETTIASKMHRPLGPDSGVHGTVSSVSGTTLTVTDKAGTVYTVNASGAKFTKFLSNSAPTDITIALVTVGDTVNVRGTVNGNTVTATNVMDGVFSMRGPPRGDMMDGKAGGMVAGTVTAVNGSVITLTGKDGGIYTVDAGTATVKKGSKDSLVGSSLSTIAVGDTVIIHGTVVTAHLTAQSIVDGVFTPKVSSDK